MLAKFTKKCFRAVGLEISRSTQPHREYPVEISLEERLILDDVLDNNLTLVGLRRLTTTLLACKFVLEHSIDGDFVECGVWRGGNALVAAAMFKLYASDKQVWLFDTFKGMTAPTDIDELHRGKKKVMVRYTEHQKDGFNEWCYSPIEDVKQEFRVRGLLSEKINFIQGDVAQTLRQASLPKKISVLRLDTDWYESTKIECQILYPKLSRGGVFLVDDYGVWEGARFAVDEYFETKATRPFFHCSDFAGRSAQKLF